MFRKTIYVQIHRYDTASFVNLEIIKFFRCLDFVGHFVIKTMRVTKMNNRVLDYSQWGDLKKNIKLLKHSKYC